jgi:hypothetical protein
LAQILATASRRETIAMWDGGGSAAAITRLYAELMRSSDDKIVELAARILAADDSSPLGKMELVVKAFTGPDGKLGAEGMLGFMEKMPNAGVDMYKPGLAWNMRHSTGLYPKLKHGGRGDGDIAERVLDAFAQMKTFDSVRMGRLHAAAERAKDYEITFRRRQFKTRLKTDILSWFSNPRQMSQDTWSMTGRTDFDKSVLYDPQPFYEGVYSFYGKNAKRLTDKVDTANQKRGINGATPIQNPGEIDAYFSALGKTTGTDFSEVAKRAREDMKGGKALSYDGLSNMAKDHVLGSALADDISMMVYAGDKIPKRHIQDLKTFLSTNPIDLTKNETFRLRMTDLQTEFGDELKRSATLKGLLGTLDGGTGRLSAIVDAAPSAPSGAVGQFGRADRDLRRLNWNQTAERAGQHLLTEAEGALGRLQQKVGQFRAGMTEQDLREYRATPLTGAKALITEQGERIQTALSEMLTRLGDSAGAAESAKQIMAASTMPQLQAAITAATSKLNARSAGWVRGAVTDIVRDFQTARFVTQAISVGTGSQSVMRRMMFNTLLDRPDVLMARSRAMLANQPAAREAFKAATGPNSVYGIRDAIGALAGQRAAVIVDPLRLPTSVKALMAAGNIDSDRVRDIVTGALNGASPEQLRGLEELESMLYDTVKDAKVVNDLVTGTYPTAADVTRLAAHLNSSPVARHMMGSLQINSQVRVVQRLIESGHGELTTAVLDSLPPAAQVSVLTRVLGGMETHWDVLQLQGLRPVLDAIQGHDPRLLAEVATHQFMPRVLGPLAGPKGVLVSHLLAGLATHYTAAFNALDTLERRVALQPGTVGGRTLDDLLSGDATRVGPARQTICGWPPNSPQIQDLTARLTQDLNPSLGEVARILNTDVPGQRAMDEILKTIHDQPGPQKFVVQMRTELMTATPTGAGALRTALSKALNGRGGQVGLIPVNKALADAFSPWLNTQPSAIQSLAMSSITKEDLMNLGDDTVREQVWTSYQSGLDGLSNIVGQDPALARFASRIQELRDVTLDQFNLDHVLGFSGVLNDVQGAKGPATVLPPQMQDALQSLTTGVDNALTQFGVDLVEKGDPFSQDILSRMFTQAPHLATAIHHAGLGKHGQGWGGLFAAMALRMLGSVVKNFEEAERDREERQRSGTDDERADIRFGRLARVYQFLIDAVRQAPPANLTQAAAGQLLQPHQQRVDDRARDVMFQGEMGLLAAEVDRGLFAQDPQLLQLQDRIRRVVALLPPQTPQSVLTLIPDLFFQNAVARNLPQRFQQALIDLSGSPLSDEQKTRIAQTLATRTAQWIDLVRMGKTQMSRPVIEGLMKVVFSAQSPIEFLEAIHQHQEVVLDYAIAYHFDRILALNEQEMGRAFAVMRNAHLMDPFYNKWREFALSEQGPQYGSGLVRALYHVVDDPYRLDPRDFDSAVGNALAPTSNGQVPLFGLIPHANEGVLSHLLLVSQGMTDFGGTDQLVNALVPQVLRERPAVLDRFLADPRIAVGHQNGLLNRLAALVTQADPAERQRYQSQLGQLSENTVISVLRRAWMLPAAAPRVSDDVLRELLDVAMARPQVVSRFISGLAPADWEMALGLLGDPRSGDAPAQARDGLHRLLAGTQGDDTFMPLLRQLLVEGQVGRPHVQQVIREHPELLVGLSGLNVVANAADAPLSGMLEAALQDNQARGRLIAAFAQTTDPHVLSNFLNVAGDIDPVFATEALTRLALDHPDIMVRLAWSLPKDGDARMAWMSTAIQNCLVNPQTNWTVHQQLQLVGGLLGMDTHAFLQTGDYRDAVKQIQNWIVEHTAPSVPGADATRQRYRPLIDAWQQSGHGRQGALRQDVQRIVDYMNVFFHPNLDTWEKTLGGMAKDPRRFQDVIQMVGHSRWTAMPENVSFLSTLVTQLQTEDDPKNPLRQVLAQVVAARALMLDLQLDLQLDVPGLDAEAWKGLSGVVFGQSIPRDLQDLSELNRRLSEHVLKLKDDVASAQIQRQDASVVHTAYQAFKALQAQVFHQRAAAAVREGSPLARTGTVDEQQRQSDINALARFRSPEELQAINVAVLRSFLAVHPPVRLPIPTAQEVADAVDGLAGAPSLSDHILQDHEIGPLLQNIAPVLNAAIVPYDADAIRAAMIQQIIYITVLSRMGPLQNIDHDQLNPQDFDAYLRSLNKGKNPANLYLKGLNPTGSLGVNQALIDGWLTSLATRPTPISRKKAFDIPDALTTFFSTLYNRDPQAAEDLVGHMRWRMDNGAAALRQRQGMPLEFGPMVIGFHRVLMALSQDVKMSGSAALQAELEAHRSLVVETYFGSLFDLLPTYSPERQQKELRTMRKLLDRFVELGDDRLTERILNEFEFNDVHVTHRVRLDAQIARWANDFSRFITTDDLPYYRPEEMDAEAQLLGGAVGKVYRQLSLADRQYVAQKLLAKCNTELQKAAKAAASDTATFADKAKVQMLLAKFANLVKKTYTNDPKLLSSGETDHRNIQTFVQQAILAASELPEGSLNNLAIASLGQMLAVSELDFSRYPGLLERLASRLHAHGLRELRHALIAKGAYRTVQQLDLGLRQIHRTSHDVSQTTQAISRAVAAGEGDGDKEVLSSLLMQAGDDQVQVLDGLLGSNLKAFTRVWRALTQSTDANARRLQGAFLTAVVADPALLKDLFLYMKSKHAAREGILVVMRQWLAEQPALTAHEAAVEAAKRAKQTLPPAPHTPLSTAAADYLRGHDRTTFVNTQNLANGRDVLAKLINGVFEFAKTDVPKDPLSSEWMMHFIQSLAGVPESTPGLDSRQTRKAISRIFEACPDLFFHPAFKSGGSNFWAQLVSRHFFAHALRSPMTTPGKEHLGARFRSLVGATMNGDLPPLLTRLIEESEKNDAKRQDLFGFIRYVLLEEKQKNLTKNAIDFKDQLINELVEHHPALYLEFLGSTVLKADKGESDLLLDISRHVFSDKQRDRLADLLLTAPLPETPNLPLHTTTLNLKEDQRAKMLAYLMIGDSTAEPLVQSRVDQYLGKTRNEAPEVMDRFLNALMAMESILGQVPFERVVFPRLRDLFGLADLSTSPATAGRGIALRVLHPELNSQTPAAVADEIKKSLTYPTPAENQKSLDAFLLEYARRQTPRAAEAVLQALPAALPTFTQANAVAARTRFIKAFNRDRMADYGKPTAVRRSPLEEVFRMHKKEMTGLSPIEQIEKIQAFIKELQTTIHRFTAPGLVVKVPGAL